MRDFITQGIITGDFTDDEKIKYTTNYLAKDVINHDDVLLILKSIYPSTYTDEGEEMVHENLEQALEEVITTASAPKEVEKLEQMVQTTSMSLSELIFMLATDGGFDVVD